LEKRQPKIGMEGNWTKGGCLPPAKRSKGSPKKPMQRDSQKKSKRRGRGLAWGETGRQLGGLGWPGDIPITSSIRVRKAGKRRDAL